MNREKQLINNTIILAIGNLSTKCMTFLLVPLYTQYLSTDEYGLVDLLNTFILLLVPIVSGQVSNGLFRYLIDADSDEQKGKVFTNTMFIAFSFSLIFVLISIPIGFYTTIPYYNLLVLGVVANIFSEIQLQYARGEGKFVVYSISSVIIALVTLTGNMTMIVVLSWGGKSILYSAVMAYFIGAVFVIIITKNYRYFRCKFLDRNMMAELIRYSLPLVPNQLSWWITNASDRIIVVFFLNAAANGILAVAHKLPSIYATVFSIYNVTWTESVCRSIDDEDGAIYISNMFNTSVKLLLELLILAIGFIPLIFDWYIGVNYHSSYPIILILCIAMFFNSIGSLYGGIYIAQKKSKEIAYSTILGAVVNIVVHVSLVKAIGLYAAALSTLVSYIVIIIIRHIQCKEIVKVHLLNRDMIFLEFLLLVTILGYLTQNFVLSLVVFLIDFVILMAANRKLVKQVIRKLHKGK